MASSQTHKSGKTKVHPYSLKNKDGYASDHYQPSQTSAAKRPAQAISTPASSSSSAKTTKSTRSASNTPARTSTTTTTASASAAAKPPSSKSNATNPPRASLATQSRTQKTTTQSASKARPEPSQNKSKTSDFDLLKVYSGNISFVKSFQQMNAPNKHETALFEVFGQLDSAISKYPSEAACCFKIKDELDCMNCVFNEIDRHLPKISRTQHIRCVGSFNLSSDRFRCVSVRLALPNEVMFNTK